MFLKDFIGKKVLSYEGKILGYTRSAFFSPNFRKITALLCSDEEEEDFILPLSAKQTVGDVFVMPRRKTAKIIGMPYSPILKQAYSVQGKFLGAVSDVLLENLAITAIIANQTEYPIEHIKTFSDCILINIDKKNAHSQTKKTLIKQNLYSKMILGRLLKFNILDKKGNLIFIKGTVITPTILKSASKQKKLLELTAKTLPIK